MKTILLPVDFSDATEAVAETALSLAEGFNARLVVLHVVYPSVIEKAYRLPPEKIDSQVAEEMEKARKRLEQWKQRLKERHPEVEIACREGNTADIIIKHARDIDASLIVVGSHGHGALYEFLVGTTTSEVIQNSFCPVVVVPVRPEG